MPTVRITIELATDDARRRVAGFQLRTDAVFLALRRRAARAMTLDEALAMSGAHAIDEVPLDTPPRGLE